MHFGKDKYLLNFVRMWASALKVNTDFVQILALPLKGCLALGKL